MGAGGVGRAAGAARTGFYRAANARRLPGAAAAVAGLRGRIPAGGTSFHSNPAARAAMPAVAAPRAGGTQESRMFMRTMVEGERSEYELVSGRIGENLPVVRELESQLEADKSAVVYGPSGSGKTEVIHIALGDKQKTFDLRHEFLENYFGKNNIPMEERREVGRRYYSDEMKAEEYRFISDNRERVIQQLIDDPKETIVFDEFDLASGKELTDDELATCRMMIDIAKEVKDRGKKIVLVLHDSALNSTSVKAKLAGTGLLMDISHVVQTRYLDEETQTMILNAYGLNQDEIDRIIEISGGSPIAYLSFLEEAARVRVGESAEQVEVPEYQDIIKDSYDRMHSNWHWSQKLFPNNLQDFLISVARGEKTLTDEFAEQNKKALLATGLVGEVNGKLVMSKIAGDVIRESLHMASLERHFTIVGKFENFEDINALLHPSQSALKKPAEFSVNVCGFGYMAETAGVLMAIPGRPAAVYETLRHARTEVAKSLAFGYLPSDRKHPEHLEWLNSATTPSELRKDAEELAEPFVALLSSVCEGSGAWLHTGEDHEFLLKSEQSIEDKVRKYSQIGSDPAKVLQKVNDPVRATIVAHNVQQLREAVRQFQSTVEGRDDLEAVFSNKWEEDYPNGYVGLHCNMKVEYTASDGETKTVRAEVQFHLSQILDGSKTCPDAVAHEFYEMGRKDENPEVTRIREDAMKAIFGEPIQRVMRSARR